MDSFRDYAILSGFNVIGTLLLIPEILFDSELLLRICSNPDKFCARLRRRGSGAALLSGDCVCVCMSLIRKKKERKKDFENM